MTKYDSGSTPQSYLEFNGCTLQRQDHRGDPLKQLLLGGHWQGSGIAGLIYSAALDAYERGKLDRGATTARGRLTRTTTAIPTLHHHAERVRQLMAWDHRRHRSGRRRGLLQGGSTRFRLHAARRRLHGPVHHRQHRRARCGPPSGPDAAAGRARPQPPTRRGRGTTSSHGYGRVNAAKAVDALSARRSLTSVKSLIPPEVKITSRSGSTRSIPRRPASTSPGVSARFQLIGLQHGARRPGPIPERRGAGRVTSSHTRPAAATTPSTEPWPRSISPSSGSSSR